MSRIILHFDINETILLADPAGGDQPEECYNKVIAKSASVQNSEGRPVFWHDGSRIGGDGAVPPLYTDWKLMPGCTPYYKSFEGSKSESKNFTEGDGSVYRPLYDRVASSVSLPAGTEVDSRLLLDSSRYLLLPAFYETIIFLDRCNENYKIVLRTFGLDLEKVLAAISAFAEGKHPDYPDFVNADLTVAPGNNGWDETKVKLYRGRYFADSHETSYRLLSWTEGSFDHNKSAIDLNCYVAAQGDDEVLSIIQNPDTKIIGIQDDYQHWANSGYNPSAGKPLWVVEDEGPHHIFFDDNIHNDPEDSIVAVRYRGTKLLPESVVEENLINSSQTSFRALSGEEILQMQGKYIVRVPTIKPIFDRRWFIDQIEVCRKSIKE